jgi:hypothetical protein
MDWFQQTQEMMKGLMDSQQKLWQSWTEGAQTSPASNWTKTLKTWENSFKNFMDTQATWTRMWVRGLSENTEIEGIEDFTKSVEEMTHKWVETQQKLWENWFEMLKQFDPEKTSATIKTDAEKAMTLWQDNMKKVLDTQTEWFNQWLKQIQDKK